MARLKKPLTLFAGSIKNKTYQYHCQIPRALQPWRLKNANRAIYFAAHKTTVQFGRVVGKYGAKASDTNDLYGYGLRCDTIQNIGCFLLTSIF